VSFIMITLAFAQMLFYLFVSLKTYGGDDGLGFRRRNGVPWINLRDDVAFYYVCVVVLLIVLGLCHRLVRSRFGLVLLGIKQNERRMAAIGLDAAPYKLAVFTLAGAIAGIAGALQANLLRFVSPDMLHWTMSGDFMVMVVLGGVGSLVGPVFGAAAMVLLQSWLAQWTEHWMIVMGPALVAVILLTRRGIWGALRGQE
jgi:branched-chain amino acid transport system permease protein